MHKYIFFFVLILTLHSAHSSIEDTVKELIKKLQDAIPEPISIAGRNITIPDNELISGFLDVHNFNATGLKAFEMTVNFIFGLIPADFNFYLKKVIVDTDYEMNLPLLHLKWLALFGLGNLHLSLSDLKFSASINIDLEHPLSDLKISLGDAQFGITGFLDDQEYSNELSQELGKGLLETINSDDFPPLAEKTLNFIISSIINRRNSTMDSLSKIDYSTEEALFLVDLLESLRLWAENVFRST